MYNDIVIYTVAEKNEKISERFQVWEFASKDGFPYIFISMDSVNFLEQKVMKYFSEKYGIKIYAQITCGQRSQKRNENTPGAAKSSFHLTGKAIDFKLWKQYYRGKPVAGTQISSIEVYDYCDKEMGDKGGVGKYNTFTHIDTRGYKARW